MAEKEESSVTASEEHSGTTAEESAAAPPAPAAAAPPPPQPAPPPPPTADEDFEIDDTQLQQEEYLKRAARAFYDQRIGKKGRPAILKMYFERVRPQESVCKFPPIEVPKGQDPDLLDIAREHWGGDYFVRLRGRGKYLGEGMIVCFAGPPRPLTSYNPWADPAQPTPAGYPAYNPGYPPQGPQPAPVVAGAGEVGQALLAFGQQMAGTLDGFKGVVESMQERLAHMERNPSDPATELKRTVDLFGTMVSVVDTIRPPAPPAPDTPPVGDAATVFLNAFNTALSHVPTALQAWQAFKAGGGAPPIQHRPAPVARPARTAPRSTAQPAAETRPIPPAADPPPQKSKSVPRSDGRAAGQPAAKKAPRPKKKAGAMKGKRKT